MAVWERLSPEFRGKRRGLVIAFWALLMSGFAMAGAVIGSSFLLAAVAHQPRLPRYHRRRFLRA